MIITHSQPMLQRTRQHLSRIPTHPSTQMRPQTAARLKLIEIEDADPGQFAACPAFLEHHPPINGWVEPPPSESLTHRVTNRPFKKRRLIRGAATHREGVGLGQSDQNSIPKLKQALRELKSPTVRHQNRQQSFTVRDKPVIKTVATIVHPNCENIVPVYCPRMSTLNPTFKSIKCQSSSEGHKVINFGRYRAQRHRKSQSWQPEEDLSLMGSRNVLIREPKRSRGRV